MDPRKNKSGVNLFCFQILGDERNDQNEDPAIKSPSGLSIPLGSCEIPGPEGNGALSPLSGAYLLIVLAKPMSESHKTKMLQKLRQGK